MPQPLLAIFSHLLGHPHGYLLYPRVLDLSRFSHVPRRACCLQSHHWAPLKQPGSVFSVLSHQVPEDSNKMPLSLCFIRLNKSYSSSLPSSIICSSCQTLLVALARLAVALENPVLWRFPTVRGKNNAVMVYIYLNETKHIKLALKLNQEW